MHKPDDMLERMREERVSLQIRVHFAELALSGDPEAVHSRTRIGNRDTTSRSLKEANAKLARLNDAISSRRPEQATRGVR